MKNLLSFCLAIAIAISSCKKDDVNNNNTNNNNTNNNTNNNSTNQLLANTILNSFQGEHVVDWEWYCEGWVCGHQDSITYTVDTITLSNVNGRAYLLNLYLDFDSIISNRVFYHCDGCPIEHYDHCSLILDASIDSFFIEQTHETLGGVWYTSIKGRK
jgi:hypothetical protein